MLQQGHRCAIRAGSPTQPVAGSPFPLAAALPMVRMAAPVSAKRLRRRRVAQPRLRHFQQKRQEIAQVKPVLLLLNPMRLYLAPRNRSPQTRMIPGPVCRLVSAGLAWHRKSVRPLSPTRQHSGTLLPLPRNGLMPSRKAIQCSGFFLNLHWVSRYSCSWCGGLYPKKTKVIRRIIDVRPKSMSRLCSMENPGDA